MNEEHISKNLETLYENSADLYLFKHRVKTNVIYIITLAAIGATIVLLPFVYVDISVSSTGYIRPITEKTIVTASITEFVDSVYVKEGQTIQKGDIILTQRAEKNKNQQNYRTELLRELDTKIADLGQLTNGDIPKKFLSMETYNEYNHSLVS